jgi:hypothetical protein
MEAGTQPFSPTAFVVRADPRSYWTEPPKYEYKGFKKYLARWGFNPLDWVVTLL